MDLLKLLIEEMVRASPDYMRKERVREEIQDVIVSLVNSGEIKSPVDLQNFFNSADMSLKALKMVPFEVYTKMKK